MGLITILEELVEICRQQACVLEDAVNRLREYDQLQVKKERLFEVLNKKIEEGED